MQGHIRGPELSDTLLKIRGRAIQCLMAGRHYRVTQEQTLDFLRGNKYEALVASGARARALEMPALASIGDQRQQSCRGMSGMQIRSLVHRSNGRVFLGVGVGVGGVVVWRAVWRMRGCSKVPIMFRCDWLINSRDRWFQNNQTEQHKMSFTSIFYFFFL